MNMVMPCRSENMLLELPIDFGYYQRFCIKIRPAYKGLSLGWYMTEYSLSCLKECRKVFIQVILKYLKVISSCVQQAPLSPASSAELGAVTFAEDESAVDQKVCFAYHQQTVIVETPKLTSALI